MALPSPSQSCGALDSYDEETRRAAGWVQPTSSKSCPIMVIVRDHKVINACFASIPADNDPMTKRFCFDKFDLDTAVSLVAYKTLFMLEEIDDVELYIDVFDATKYQENSCKLQCKLFGRNISEFEKAKQIPLSEPFMKQYASVIVRNGLSYFGSKDLNHFVSHHISSINVNNIVLKDFLFRDGPNSESKFSMEVGSVSSDESSVVGRDGHIFIFRGSNRLYEQYFAEKEWAVDCARKWIELFERRRRSSEMHGAKFFQFIIPEKSSIVPESFPKSITPPMPLVRELSEFITNKNLDKTFIVLQNYMESSADRTELFRRIDCHLNFFGCQKTFIEMLRVMGFPNHPEILLDDPIVLRGDVGSRFPGVVEFLLAPNRVQAKEFEIGLSLVEQYSPSSGIRGHRRVFRNSNARYPRKVVAFANSFFALGDAAHELTWWFARNFAEFHFVWMSEFEEEYIRKVKPDIVFAQTIERFLGVIPER
ncbi:hypothetical protein [Methylocystis parvus]|uniref:AlgX/AlgJ SGNH hydrolase-like domain-containing protein n=1 Tax=Methylocystis parvus TaxID=134 RepID=A0A6B8MBW5_9HYPH|nr:hypothetical protein [Methylocystis parvus]QGM98823.1 hypothetical protein F7D14_15915 [Methylocystis parvus]WBK00827.1 hypothetical protein MMG94_03640 [Methylocystis parvus OBBP]